MSYSKHLTSYLERRGAIALKVATEMFLEKNADRLDSGHTVEIVPVVKDEMTAERIASALIEDKDKAFKVEEIDGVYYVTWFKGE